MENLYWYEFSQNNSGGYFKVDDKVCHRLFIEAHDSNEAISKAEELGCYWDGVEKGIDCSCCGDRWSNYWIEPIKLDRYIKEGYKCSSYSGEEDWYKKYGKYNIIEEPKFCKGFIDSFVGKISFTGIEDYAQFMADEYGWTVPDIRLYYYDGNVKEIFSDRGGLYEE